MDALKNPGAAHSIIEKESVPNFGEKLLKHAPAHQKGQFARIALEAYQSVGSHPLMRQGYLKVTNK